MKLTDEDVKLIKYERRIGYAISGALFGIGIIWNLSYLSSGENSISLQLILIDLALITVCIFLPYYVNRKYNLDLKNGIKTVKVETIQNKKKIVDNEPGSGKLYIPILGDLFPKQWGQEMREFQKSVLQINGAHYNVDNNLFDKVDKGDEVEMYYAKYSKTFLGIDIKKK